MIDKRARLGPIEWAVIVAWAVAFFALLFLTCDPVPAHSGVAGVWQNSGRVPYQRMQVEADSTYAFTFGVLLGTCCTDLTVDSATWEAMPCKANGTVFAPVIVVRGRAHVQDARNEAFFDTTIGGQRYEGLVRWVHMPVDSVYEAFSQTAVWDTDSTWMAAALPPTFVTESVYFWYVYTADAPCYGGRTEWGRLTK